MSKDNVLVTGGAGELGSNFSKICIDKGYRVKIIDTVRQNEAWRLKWLDIYDDVEYIWKSSFDIDTDDIEDVDLIMDCACQPDRPFGTSAPVYTMIDNLLGPTNLLETVRKYDNTIPIIYPSSCNVFLGVPKKDQPLTEKSKPMPTNYYGWSKLAAEELYLTYHRCYDLPVYIIRTGSCYGPGMRTDQMVAKCILHMFNNKDFYVRSPLASRTYTYAGDVLEFFKKLLNVLDEIPSGTIIHNGGNKENKAYTTMQVAETIKDMIDSDGDLIEFDYEEGEILKEPVMQWENSEFAERLLDWKPEHTLKEGLDKTIEWFAKRIGDYTV